TWTKLLNVPAEQRKYAFELADSHGEVLLRQTEGQYDWTPDGEIKVGPQSNYVFPEEASRTEDDWLQTGRMQELDGNKLATLGTYEKALRKFPASFELLKASGRLLTSLKRFEEAVPRLSVAHSRNTTDGEVSYYFGIAEEGSGRERDAINAF